MLPGVMLPISLRRLLDAFAGCFTTPTFVVFQAMVLGLVAQTGQRTVVASTITPKADGGLLPMRPIPEASDPDPQSWPADVTAITVTVRSDLSAAEEHA